MVRPTLLCLALLVCLASSTARAVEASARVGLASPQGDSVHLGPSLGLILSVPLRARVGLFASADWTSHSLSSHADRHIESVTGALGLEAGLDLSPIIPVVCIGPAYQHAWRVDRVARTDKLAAMVGLGLRTTLVEHLRLGLMARYLSAGFTGDSFPAFATFALEVGWTSE
jgi:hypothetical protein